jgi:hypothetical protein
MKKYKLLFLIIFFTSCSKNYEQYYNNYEDFSKQNQRNKGWFPDLISKDVFNLKSSSSLDPFHNFGVFEYTNENYYDTIFKKKNGVKISISDFEKIIKNNIESKPNWFLNITDIKNKDLKVVKYENFILAKSNKEKKIYFVLSDGVNFDRLRKTPQNQ